MAVGLTALAAAALAVWLYLLFGHGGFWRADQRLDAPGGTLDAWPAVAAVVPWCWPTATNSSGKPSPRYASSIPGLILVS